jgi:hypothetical protein
MMRQVKAIYRSFREAKTSARFANLHTLRSLAVHQQTSRIFMQIRNMKEN